MANEIRIGASLTITADSQRQYQSRPGAFVDDLLGSFKGPTPGVLVVTTAGRDVYFTELTTPGLCFLHNLSEDYTVEVGVFDTITGRFHPLCELPPGVGYPICLSRNLQEQYTGSGTGTTAAESYLRLKAVGGTCDVSVEAFEK